ncbi:MAG: hypothetical protein J6V22_03275 [Clostridia bacterium]|nr:hypothetical protein [Clostridia bacterium]
MDKYYIYYIIFAGAVSRGNFFEGDFQTQNVERQSQNNRQPVILSEVELLRVERSERAKARDP